MRPDASRYRERVDEGLESAKERAWREVAAIDQAYERGELDDEGWHAEAAKLVVPAYLAANTPQGGSGHSGTADDWEYSRGIVAEALDRSGTFLDIGCANGHLMESVSRWAAVEPYGLEISPELAELARTRLPHWAERIWVGNAWSWEPPHRFDVVRTGLEYVPAPQRRQYVERLLSYCDRLVIGVFNEERHTQARESQVASWGFTVAGRSERPHPHPALAYRAFWIDAVG